jgi:hypothetical protein
MPSALQLASCNDYRQQNAEEHTVPLLSSVALRVYSNTKPFNLKIANLQKGLIFVHNGIERVGEGTGFGFPVLIYGKETFFSASSTISVAHPGSFVRIRKEFFMDRIARNKFRNVHLENAQARTFIKYLTELYQRNKSLRFLSLKEFFVNMGVESVFVKTASIGKIIVTYDLSSCVVNVKVDFSQLKKKHPQKIFILNEQSASFFRKYSVAQYESFVDEQIGAWDIVDSDWACLTDLQESVGFRLWNINGCVLRRGREIMNGHMDWAGLDYEVYPQNDVFEYKIEILGGNG